MKILKNKEKSGFKGTIIKIGIAVLVAFMVFGAFRSCVKVKASTTSIDSNTYYVWDSNLLPIYSLIGEDTTYMLTSSSTFFSYGNIVFNRLSITSYHHTEIDTSTNPATTTYFKDFSISYSNTNTNEVVVLYRSTYQLFSNEYRLISDGFYNDASRTIYFYCDLSDISIFYTDASNPLSVSDLLLPYLTISTLSDNPSYERGWEEGYKYGLANADFDSAYLAGREAGISYQRDLDNASMYTQDEVDTLVNNARDEGFSDGYDSNLNAHTYTFENLLFAVFEVPVKTFIGLFNFNFLGVNLAGFFLSIFTLACIVMIVKRFI